MPGETALPKDSPIMLEWERYKSTDEYVNAPKWAAVSEHRNGSLWESFHRGWAVAERFHVAEIERLQKALESVLVGGNHLALLIGTNHPPYTASHDEALRHYKLEPDHDTYEAWCCWRAIMQARDVLKPYAKETKNA